MEYVFIGPVMLPLTPAKIEESTPSGNETVRLINDGEINIRHSPGLKTFTFDVILPTLYSYPFQNYSLGGTEATAFKKYFDELHKQKLPFPFIHCTSDDGSNGRLNIDYVNLLCTIEDMTDLRDADNGQDKIISLMLKEFKDYGTKYAKEGSTDSNGNITYKVSKGSSQTAGMDKVNQLAQAIIASIGAIGTNKANNLIR